MLCGAGWAGKYYADRLRRFDAAIAKLDASCDELFDQDKDEAALEILARCEQLEAQRLLLETELHRGMGSLQWDPSLSEKDRAAGVPFGTTYRLETTYQLTCGWPAELLLLLLLTNPHSTRGKVVPTWAK